MAKEVLLTQSGYDALVKELEYLKTEKRKEIAEKTYSRHQLIKEILLAIGVSEENASEDACKIEHDICEETYKKLSEVYLKLKKQ